jgi:hypothetical protein
MKSIRIAIILLQRIEAVNHAAIKGVEDREGRP